jgi:hypothetical protein
MSLLRQDVRLPESSIHDFGRDMVVALQVRQGCRGLQLQPCAGSNVRQQLRQCSYVEQQQRHAQLRNH